MKMHCNTNKSPESSFCGPHSKPHGAWGMGKHYHLRFDPKLGNVVCAIICIPCACVACISMLYKPWIYGIQPNRKEHYKPVTKCTYWTLLEPFNNWNIIQLSHKSTPYDAYADEDITALAKASN